MFEVASSRMRIRGSASSARAIEISWRSPAERPAPPSRTSWSRPPESRAATRSTPTAAAAAATSSSVASGFAKRMFDAIVPLKRNGILQHDAELAAVRAELDVAQVGAVDAHRALVGVVVAADEPRERRLAVARLADEREAVSRREMERDAVQHRILAVREDDRVDLEIALDARQRRRAGPVADVGLLVEDARDLDHRRAGRLQLAVDVRELLQRLEDELEEVRAP